MACVEKIEHDVPHCTAEKGLQVFYEDQLGTYTGYCFSCAARGLEAYVKDPYLGDKPEPPKKKTQQEIDLEIQEIKNLPFPDFDFRGIPKEYFRRAGVRLSHSEYTGKLNALNFPLSLKGKLSGYKTVLLDKKIMWSIGESTGVDLFNWEVAKKKGVKRLYITEGQWDCLALEYMLEKQSGGKYKYAVTSIPNGVKSAAVTIGRMRKEIEEIFEEVVLVFDFDEAGCKAVKEVQKVMPNILEAPHITGVKDANEALEKGYITQFADLVLWKARKPLMQGVVTVSEVLQRDDKPPTVGLSYPYKTLTDVMHGQQWGDTTCIAGAVGGGKTTLAHEFAAWNMTQHGIPCFLALLEEANKKTLWNIAGKIDSIQYARTEVFEQHKERYYDTISKLEDKLFIWSSEGNSEYRFNLPEILSAVRFNHFEYGCMFFDLDNITRIVDGMPTTEANEFINKYSSELANLAAELGIHIRAYSHLNLPGKGQRSHEEGGAVLASQITGSRGVMRSFPNIFGFERNSMATGPEQHNSYLSIVKHRDLGDKKKIKTQYQPKSGRLLEFNWEGDSLY